jgi:D-alanine-D-alanine ligase
MMTLGFTYDLRDDYLAQGFSAEDAAEFDSQVTIDAIELALQQYGFNVEKIGNIKALTVALAAGKSWDIVFNICEGVKGIGREAQVPALLEAYGVPCVFSGSDVMVLTMNKALAKLVVHSGGSWGDVLRRSQRALAQCA